MKYQYSSVIIISVLLSAQLCAQGNNNITLKVGDKAPDLNAYQWVKGAPVNIFKKGKTYLVDFGATWCVPCAKAIPHLSQIAKAYSATTEVLGVFVMEPKKDSLDNSYVQNVKKYVQKQGDNIQFSVAVDGPKATIEKNWITAAGLNGVPQTFLIDRNGLIAWIGSSNSTSLDESVKFVNSSSYTIASAIEKSNSEKSLGPVKIDIHKPMFLDDNGGKGDDFYFRAILTPYKGESAANSHVVYSAKTMHISSKTQPKAGMVQGVGVSIEELYYMAYADTLMNQMFSRRPGTNEWPDVDKYPGFRSSYGNFWYKAIVEVSDSTPFLVNYDFTTNRYNYSLIVPDELATAEYLQKVMRKDLDSYFDYDVKVEDRKMPYWRLIARPGAKERLKTKTPTEHFGAIRLHDTAYQYHNAIMKDILWRIVYSFSYGQSIYGRVKPREEAPFIDETGISGDIDYYITNQEFQSILDGNWQAALDFLHRLGLDLLKGERMTKVVVIRDLKKG